MSYLFLLYLIIGAFRMDHGKTDVRGIRRSVVDDHNRSRGDRGAITFAVVRSRYRNPDSVAGLENMGHRQKCKHKLHRFARPQWLGVFPMTAMIGQAEIFVSGLAFPFCHIAMVSHLGVMPTASVHNGGADCRFHRHRDPALVQ